MDTEETPLFKDRASQIEATLEDPNYMHSIFPNPKIYHKLDGEWLINRIQNFQEYLSIYLQNQSVMYHEEQTLYQYLYKAQSLNDIIKQFNELADDVLKMEYEVFRKYDSNRLTKTQADYWEKLTGKQPEYNEIIKPMIDYSPAGRVVKSQYELNCKTDRLEEFFNFLLQHDYIDSDSEFSVFEKIFNFEPIPVHQRIKWIHTWGGQYSLRSLLAVIRPRIKCLDQTSGFGIFMSQYFCLGQRPVNGGSAVTIGTSILDGYKISADPEGTLRNAANQLIPTIYDVPEKQQQRHMMNFF
jgi:hypothetical protein